MIRRKHDSIVASFALGFIALYTYVALSNVFYPFADYFEALFVQGVLADMRGVPDQSNGDIHGPNVATGKVIFVTGTLTADSTPKDSVTGESFPGCVAVRRVLKIKRDGLSALLASDARISERAMVGDRLSLGRWVIDPDFMRGRVLPFVRTHSGPEEGFVSATDCPENRQCTVTLDCLEPGTMSIIGIEGVSDDGKPIVKLPDQSLADYPLVQSGILSSDDFARQYWLLMAGRVPLLRMESMLILQGLTGIALFMATFWRRFTPPTVTGVDSFVKAATEFFSAESEPLGNKLALLIVVGVPVLPLLVYGRPVWAFFPLMAIYIVGIFFALRLFYCRFHDDLPAYPPT